MGRLRTLLGGFGIFATLFGTVTLVASEPLTTGPLSILTESFAEADAAMLMLISGLLAGFLMTITLRPRSAADEQLDGRFEQAMQDVERAGMSATAPFGGEQAPFERAVREGGESFRTVRERLAESAARTYADVAGISQEQAYAAVDSGTWTDDRLAGAVLAGSPPVVAQIRLWVGPHRERRRRIERTLAAIEEVQD